MKVHKTEGVTTTASASGAEVQERRCLILFVSDFHGRLEGIYDVDAQGHSMSAGGLTALKQTLNRLRRYSAFETGTSEGVLLCLGGDMLGWKWCSRFVHEGTATRVWDLLLANLNPDAFVLGNHELSDFPKTADDILAMCDERGCTRNLDFADRIHERNRCCSERGLKAPPFSIHTEVCRNGTVFCFIGITTMRSDKPQLVGHDYVCSPSKEAERVVLEQCLNQCPKFSDTLPKEAVVVLLAHYGELQTPPTRSYEFEQEFGEHWWNLGQNHAAANGSCRLPHVILKAHDHNEPSSHSNGHIDRLQTHEKRSELGQPITWVPTFGAGFDGEYVGKLLLTIKQDRIDYDWTPVMVVRSETIEEEDRSLLHPLPLDPQDIVTDINFEPFGGTVGNVDPWYRALCLFLRAVLHHAPKDQLNIAIIPASALVRHSLVTDRRRQIDRFDLYHVFAENTVIGLGSTNIKDFSETLLAALLSSTFRRPAIVPPSLVEAQSGRKSAEQARAFCLRITHGDRAETLLLVAPTDRLDAPKLHRLRYEKDRQGLDCAFYIEPTTDYKLANFIQSQWPHAPTYARLTTTLHAAQRLIWPHRGFNRPSSLDDIPLDRRLLAYLAAYKQDAKGAFWLP